MATQLIHAIVDGILTGGVYALMAVGLTLIFGVLDIINIAQGVLVILGAYLSYSLSVHLHIDLFVGLLITVPAMFALGVALTAAGGMVFGATSGGFNANSGYDLISRMLAIIILGGMGSIGGALTASVFMLTVEAVVSIWYPEWSIVVFYAALVLVLVIRPAGFLGRKAVRTA